MVILYETSHTSDKKGVLATFPFYQITEKDPHDPVYPALTDLKTLWEVKIEEDHFLLPFRIESNCIFYSKYNIENKSAGIVSLVPLYPLVQDNETKTILFDPSKTTVNVSFSRSNELDKTQNTVLSVGDHYVVRLGMVWDYFISARETLEKWNRWE